MSTQIICAWCKKPMGEKQGNAEFPVSHGICPECAQKYRIEIGKLSQLTLKEENEE
ncbi:MAG: hypothetical protein ABIK92_06540 [Pseudomonadota bacterium]